VMDDVFSVRLRVRGYEVDTQGHLNWAEYLHYAEHARWECLKAAGITQDTLIATGFGPASLTSTSGLLDLRERKLADDPGKHFRSLATDPSPLGQA
jgi:acyl-CoA thioester hydrolase